MLRMRMWTCGRAGSGMCICVGGCVCMCYVSVCERENIVQFVIIKMSKLDLIVCPYRCLCITALTGKVFDK